MADDILLTPEEQDERAKQWLKDNALSLIVGIAIGVGIIFGINYYRTQQQVQAETASELYSTVSASIAESDQADIDSQVEQLKSNHAKSSYAAKAALIKAKQISNSDLAAAASELNWVLNNAPESGLQHAARLRLIKVLLAQKEIDQAAVLANYKDISGFESHYYEAIADVAIQQQDLSKAKTNYQQAIDALAQNETAYKSILTLKLNQIAK